MRRPKLGVRHHWLILLSNRFAAVTRPPFGIYFNIDWWRTATVGRRLRTLRHEMAHWRQYQEMGFWRFHAKWVYYTLRYGYNNNPMELEARASE